MEGDTVKVASRFDFTLIGLDGLDASQPTALKFPSPLSSGKALDQLELSDLVPVCLESGPHDYLLPRGEEQTRVG